MSIFGKNKKTEKLDCIIREKVEHLGETYTLANSNNGHWSFDFEVTEIVHFDDGNDTYLKGRGKSKNFYLPIDRNDWSGKPASSLATKDFEFLISIREDPRKWAEGLLEQYKIDSSKLFMDYNSYLHDKGIASLTFDDYKLKLWLYLKDEIYQKIYSAIKIGSVSKMEFKVVLFNLYRSDSDKNSDILYIENNTADKFYESEGLFNNLIIETHKTIIS